MESRDKMKKFIKSAIVFVALGTCLIYIYSFLTGDVSDEKPTADEAEEEYIGPADGEEIAHYQTPSPDRLKSIEDGWERVKYAFLPGMPDLRWIEMNEEYLLVRKNVSYKVVDTAISKKWNKKWNYAILKHGYYYEDYKLDEKHNLKDKRSYLSVCVEMENKGKDTCLLCLSNTAVFIYNDKGKDLASGILSTMSVKKQISPTTKTTWFEKIKPGEKRRIELVYVFKDKFLLDDYYYFFEVLPGGGFPGSTNDIGVFKLPYGVERENQNDEE